MAILQAHEGFAASTSFGPPEPCSDNYNVQTWPQFEGRKGAIPATRRKFGCIDSCAGFSVLYCLATLGLSFGTFRRGLLLDGRLLFGAFRRLLFLCRAFLRVPRLANGGRNRISLGGDGAECGSNGFSNTRE